ncbi:MAG: tRNA (cytosine(32)/uridine(32)-2'-O)-methyltransferase TrmJ [Pseudomonadales bacterium]
MLDLKNIRIVLIDTSHPGNIGAAARAMKNMGLDKLYLVAPKKFPDDQAVWRASSAGDVLDKAVVCETLDEALEGCELVLGASARDRSMPWPVMDPRQSAETVMSEPEQHQVAILFGREDRGMTNEELQRCHFHLQIPANPEYTSLNIGAAVQVVCYELRMAMLNKAGLKEAWDWDKEWDVEAASADEMRYFLEHFEETLLALGVINPKRPRQLMPRMKRLFIRSRMDKMEVSILRGVLTAAQKLLRKE